MDKSVSKTKELPWSELGIHRVPEEDEDKIADSICETCQVDRSLLMRPFWRLTKPDEASASYFTNLGLNRYLLNKAILAWHEKKLPSVGKSKRQEANDQTSMDESTAYETAPEEDPGSVIAEIPRDDGRANYRIRFMEPVILDNSSAVEELARDDEAGNQSIEFIETILLDSSETTFLPKSTAIRNLRPILPKPMTGTDGLSPPIALPTVGRGTQAEQENRPVYTFLHHLPGSGNTIPQAHPTWPQPRPTLPRIDALNAIAPKETVPTSTHSVEPTNAPTFMTKRSRAYPFAPAPPTAAKGPTEAETAKELAQNFSYGQPNPEDHQPAFHQPSGTKAMAPKAANPTSAQAAEPKAAPSSMVHRFRPYPLAPIPQPAAKSGLAERTKRKEPIRTLWSHPRHLHPTLPPSKAKKQRNTWYGPPLTTAQRHPHFSQQAAANSPTETAAAAAAKTNDAPDIQLWHPKPKNAHQRPTFLQPGNLNPIAPPTHPLPIFPPQLNNFNPIFPTPHNPSTATTKILTSPALTTALAKRINIPPFILHRLLTFPSPR